VRITITPDGYIPASHDVPTVGLTYHLDEDIEGTGKQNRAFHALISVYWKSGLHSYNAKTFDEFRNLIKMHLGAGFDRFVYADIVDGKAVIIEAATKDDIPSRIWRDPDRRRLVRGRLKSWGDYTKKERVRTIDLLISEMHQAGVNTPKFYEILEGMENATA